MGADVRLDPAGFDIGICRSWEDALQSVEEAGGKPYAIPAGASDHPLGGLGFARWAQEVAEQEQGLAVFFDTIVVCSVTGSTQAGMIAGFALQERPRAVLGVDGSATVAQTWDQIARIARSTADAIGLGRPLRDDEIVLLDEWHAGTYGIPDEKTIDAIRLCARLEGMLTDPVYEGKSMAALIDLVRSVASSQGRRCSTRTSAGSLRSTRTRARSRPQPFEPGVAGWTSSSASASQRRCSRPRCGSTARKSASSFGRVAFALKSRTISGRPYGMPSAARSLGRKACGCVRRAGRSTCPRRQARA